MDGFYLLGVLALAVSTAVAAVALQRLAGLEASR